MLAVEKNLIDMETGMQGLHLSYSPAVAFGDGSPSMEYMADIQHEMEFKARIRHSPVWPMILKLEDFLSRATT